MKKIMSLFAVIAIAVCACAQDYLVSQEPVNNKDLSTEITKLKEMVRQLQENELQSDKIKYQKNYQLIINGLETIKEMQQGIMEITGARSQNILYKKLIDINNPTSEVLGFQLIDVINKTLEENINAITSLAEGDKKRLKGQTSGLFEGLKRAFPPLQIITGAFSAISSFTTYKTRVEKIGRKADSIIVDVTNPITQEVIGRMSGNLQPYIVFYNELNKVNAVFENALYQHEVEYKDFIEEVSLLRQAIEKRINLGESVSSQVVELFDLTNSSAQDFNYKSKLENEPIRELVGNCVNVFELVDRYKKFTNDFVTIQDDFYRSNLELLSKKAKYLPYKDVAKIDQLITDLDLLKNGNNATNTAGFDASYKLRLKGLLSKLYAVNKLRM
ncbi:MAG TPA: hypothetical protein VF476_08545 [Chitinophagaceae bacterium]